MRRESATHRSIPAHAGEPERRWGVARLLPVYPRPRGGTPVCGAFVYVPEGLSPPTRGNPTLGAAIRELARSIPAHAGEPSFAPF